MHLKKYENICLKIVTQFVPIPLHAHIASGSRMVALGTRTYTQAMSRSGSG